MHDPAVPETLEGWSVLHQMFRVRWADLRRMSDEDRAALAREAAATLSAMEQPPEGATVLAHLLGHKGDLMLVHFRPTFEDLGAAELQWTRTRLADYLEPTNSYLSIVELGMYDYTSATHKALADEGLEHGTDAFNRAFDERMDKQKERVAARLYPQIPDRRFICFYPMDKHRGEHKNWYQVPFDQRAGMMMDHGMVGRRFTGRVTQIISGSIGLDDWEWGVDLFAADPLVFKKLIYEMRFDEASAVYAKFGDFFIGLRFPASEIGTFIAGEPPAYHTPAAS